MLDTRLKEMTQAITANTSQAERSIGDLTAATTETLVPTAWVCVEWHVDGASSHLQLWLDGRPQTEVEVMGRLGAPWTREDQKQLLGGSMPRTVSYLLGKATTPAPPETVAQWMTDGMLERAAAGRVTVMPGARELLAEVAAAGLPYALVTSSERPLAEAVLASAGLRFPVSVTGDDVPVTKPDPAPYLLAAKLLEVDPGSCVALEDSPNGAASATAAGCRVVAVPSFGEVPAAPGRLIVGSLRDVTLGSLRDLAQDPQRQRREQRQR